MKASISSLESEKLENTVDAVAFMRRNIKLELYVQFERYSALMLTLLLDRKRAMISYHRRLYDHI